MKSHLECECLCFSSALFLILTSCHEIPSSVWVPVLLLSSVSDLWPHAMKSHSGCESLCFFSALSLIFDPMQWNPSQLVSPCASAQLCLWSLTPCHEIPSSLWVSVLLLSSVSHIWPFRTWVPVLLLSSVSDLWPHAMKSLPGCESMCFFSALSLISDPMLWNSIQPVSSCASSQLCLWLPCHEIPFRVWVPMLLLSSVSDLWPLVMKSHSACESLCFSSALSLISDLLL